ncbi:hypothetical protein F7725_020631 [Dissostichus mawsoni]|uniref:Receptor ligand binding region domain-containing protein n=1 Tax=Dissostichus mawsoni TaxID=36200 RepID=A0A7J5YEQ1_DISMA|nr:hypothetical protein F7725_020631 [Dissostichus mawsoni]
MSLCSINSRRLRFSRAMVFAIEQINNSTELLPGIKLGYEIYDSCASVSVAVHVAFQLSGDWTRCLTQAKNARSLVW